MKETILFVDDEPNILQALQRLLRPRRHEWEMTFVSSALEAIQLMKRQCYDVVVTDMRMPEMDGAELLEEVKKLCPCSVRIILSGQAEIETIVKSVRCAHQYLSKPCNPELLESTINRASQLRKNMANDDLRNFVSQIQALPSRPSIYLDVRKELENAAPSIEKIANLVSHDIGMSIKVLQLTNSSFFGHKREVISASEAVSILGVEIMRKLFIDSNIFRNNESESIGALKLKSLHERGVAVGNFTLRIATLEGLDSGKADLCSTAALICRVGCLILSSFALENYAEVLQINEECQASVNLERKLFGTSHSEIGAYLLGLWGLPDEMVYAASKHHECGDMEHGKFSVLTALQLAEHLASSNQFQTGGCPETLSFHNEFKDKYSHILKEHTPT